MSNESTINVRMPAQLKRAGGKVLDRNGISPSEAVRGLYAYLQREQEVPSFLLCDGRTAASVYERRRKLARTVTGMLSDDEPADVKALSYERAAKPYEETL